jgi:hypothetical protein
MLGQRVRSKSSAKKASPSRHLSREALPAGSTHGNTSEDLSCGGSTEKNYRYSIE